MSIIKNKRGITLIALILTIVVTLILTTIVIKTSTENMEYSRMVQFVSYMQMIQKKVDLMIDNNEYEEIGETLGNAELIELTDIIESENNQETILNTNLNNDILKYFNQNNLSQQLEIDDIKDDIVVNFTNHEVISLNGVSFKGKRHYTQYGLPGGQKIKQATDQINQDRNIAAHEDIRIEYIINGLNAKFKISGFNLTNATLSYCTNYDEVDQTPRWTIVTNYTVKDEYIYTENLTKSGTYYFKLVDNTNHENYFVSDPVPLILTNSPQVKGNLEILTNEYNYSGLDSESWAYATDTTNNNVYVWIPRFAYKNVGQNVVIEFLKGTSDLTTSGGYITDDWTVPEVFGDLTGVWILASNGVESGLDVLNILTGTIY